MGMVVLYPTSSPRLAVMQDVFLIDNRALASIYIYDTMWFENAKHTRELLYKNTRDSSSGTRSPRSFWLARRLGEKLHGVLGLDVYASFAELQHRVACELPEFGARG